MVLRAMIISTITASSDPFLWYLTRDLAIAAYFTLTLSVLFGLAISLARVTGTRVMWYIEDLHSTTATLSGVLIAGHMITLYFDPYLPFSLGNLLLPLSQPLDTLAVDLGVLGFYATLALLLSSWLRRRMSYSLWRLIHYVSFLAFVLSTVHGWLSGSDSATSFMRSLYFGCTLAVGSLVAARFFISPHPQQAKQPRVIPISLFIAFIVGVIGTMAMFIIVQG